MSEPKAHHCKCSQIESCEIFVHPDPLVQKLLAKLSEELSIYNTRTGALSYVILNSDRPDGGNFHSVTINTKTLSIDYKARCAELQAKLANAETIICEHLGRAIKAEQALAEAKRDTERLLATLAECRDISTTFCCSASCEEDAFNLRSVIDSATHAACQTAEGETKP